MATPLDAVIKLEPRSLGSVEPYEPLKILDNTVAVYRELKHRTAQEVESSTRIQQSHQETSVEAEKDDVALAKYEKELFTISDASDRQLYLHHLREETDLFLLFADWAERQRQKFLVPMLRNAPVWEEVEQHKTLAVQALLELTGVFGMLKNPPMTGYIPSVNSRHNEISRQRTRQMMLFSAMNHTNRLEELDEALVALDRRQRLCNQFVAQVEKTRNLLKLGREQQLTFMLLVEKISSNWNVTKVPYETQVFHGADSDYPYRGEMWIQMLNVPRDCWGAEILEDPRVNMAPQLWQYADDAGYTPQRERDVDDGDDGAQTHGQEDQDTTEQLLDWREKRVKRRFGHPYFLSPPVPVSSPFEPYWCEIFVTSRTDEERLPKSAARLILGEDAPDLEETEDESGSKEGINIGVFLKGDIGAYVKEERKLGCEIVIKSLSWFDEMPRPVPDNQSTRTKDPAPSTPAPTPAATPAATEGLRATCATLEDPEGKGPEAIAEEAYQHLFEFLLVVQRTCMDRTLFALLAAQATRMLREMTYPLIDDEALARITDHLKNRTIKIETIRDMALLLKPLMCVEDPRFRFTPDARPSYFELPSSWVCWPLLANRFGSPVSKAQGLQPGTKLHYLAARKDVNIVFTDSENLSFTMHNVPLILPADRSKGPPRIVGAVDLLITISFSATVKGIKRTAVYADADSVRDRQLKVVLQGLEEMSVCKLRQLFLEVLQPKCKVDPLLQFDLFHINIPKTRTQRGPLVLVDFQTWLFSHVAMAIYDVAG